MISVEVDDGPSSAIAHPQVGLVQEILKCAAQQAWQHLVVKGPGLDGYRKGRSIAILQPAKILQGEGYPSCQRIPALLSL